MKATVEICIKEELAHNAQSHQEVKKEIEKETSDLHFVFRKLDRVKVKGKKLPVEIFELVIEEDKKFIQEYERALDLYFNQKFAEAKKGFEKALKINFDDKSAKLFCERCETYLKNPPAGDWDGSFQMKTK